MMESESIAQLAEALAKAQGQMSAPKKARKAKVQTKSGSGYGYNYADISDIIECVKKVLSENGIAFSQATYITDAGGLMLRTKLMHGAEWIASDYPLPMNVPPQEMGSLLSYHRRYQLCCLCGVAAEDDDDGKTADDAHRGGLRDVAVTDDPRPEPSLSRQASAGNGPERTTAPRQDAAAWKQDAEDLQKLLRSAKTPEQVDEFVALSTNKMAELKKHSQTAYDFLITGAQKRKMAMLNDAADPALNDPLPEHLK